MQEYFQIALQTLTDWVTSLAALLPNFVVAVALLLVFVALSRLSKRLASRAAGRMSDSTVIVRLCERVARYGTIFAGMFIALGVLGLDKTVTSLLAGAGVVGIALGFAFQDIAANFVAGVLMGFRRPFAIGDVVETGDFMGTIKGLDLRTTVLQTFSGQSVRVPNSEVFTNPIINFHETKRRRVAIDVGISYDADIEKAVRAAKAAVEALDFRLEDSDVDVFAHEFGGSSINLKVHYWIAYPGDTSYNHALHAGIVAVKKAFDEQGIGIPFPTRTLEMVNWPKALAELDMTKARPEPNNGESRASA